MKTKNLIAAILLLLVVTPSFSQAGFGRIQMRPEYNSKKIKQEDLKKIKNSTTYFVIPSDIKKYSKDDYQQVLDDVWTITPIKVISENEIFNSFKEGDTYIKMRNYTKGIVKNAYQANQGLKNSYIFNYFEFKYITKTWMENKTLNWNTERLGIIFFTSDVQARRQSRDILLEKTNGSPLDEESGSLLDFNLGYIKNYFQQLNEYIANGEELDIYEDLEEMDHLRKLKTEKLYLSENFLYSYNPFFWKEGDKSAKELFEGYKYPYEVLSDDTLNEKILIAEENFYYLMWHQKNAHKIITVVEAKTGKVIYSTKTSLSYNMKPKDVNALFKAISKA